MPTTEPLLLTHDKNWIEHVPPAPGWPRLCWWSIIGQAGPTKWWCKTDQYGVAAEFTQDVPVKRIGFVLGPA